MVAKKRIIFTALAIMLLLSCTACGGSSANDYQNTMPSDNEGAVYKIADYYDEYGGYSSLGLALTEENSEKVLTVIKDDTLVVGDRKYIVMAKSITIPFYTHNSFDEVVEWWKDYCKSRIERGEVIETG